MGLRWRLSLAHAVKHKNIDKAGIRSLFIFNHHESLYSSDLDLRINFSKKTFLVNSIQFQSKLTTFIGSYKVVISKAYLYSSLWLFVSFTDITY